MPSHSSQNEPSVCLCPTSMLDNGNTAFVASFDTQETLCFPASMRASMWCITRSLGSTTLIPQATLLIFGM